MRPKITGGPQRKKDKFTRLKDLDEQVERARSSGDEEELAAAFTERGRFKIRHRIAGGGLKDMLFAHARRGQDPSEFDVLDLFNAFCLEGKVEGTDVTQLAYLGEAFRVYARDVLLSEEDLGWVEKAVEVSLVCFDKAAQLTSTPNYQAWIFAHRGGARMMRYWLDLVDGTSNDTEFDKCRQDFQRALELRENDYAWCSQFLAFLYALRARPADPANPKERGDFEQARKLLEPLIKISSTTRQASLWRSIAMLYSYDATRTDPDSKDEPERRAKAARASMDAGLKAMLIDQDEFMGPYFAAVSQWALYDIELQRAKHADCTTYEEKRQRTNVEEGLDIAETRSKNAISQALATLVGIAFVRGRIADPKGPNRNGPAESAEQLVALFQQFSPDLETRAMFHRDPAWWAISQSSTWRDSFVQREAGYEHVRQRYSRARGKK